MGLISNPDATRELHDEWEGAGKMLCRMRRHVRGAFAGLVQPGLAHVVYNLPLLLACDVLEQVLAKAKCQYGFGSKSASLGDLLTGANKSPDVPFIDYETLRRAVHRRTEVAHEGVLLSADECHLHIANIEKQLLAWNILGELRDPDSYDLDDAPVR
jgi:hypothetical protein